MPSPKDRYTIQKIAILPVASEHKRDEIEDILNGCSSELLGRVLQSIFHNRLGPLWLEKIGKDSIQKIWDEKQAQLLSDQYRQFAVLYFQQLIAIRKVTELFDRHGFEHAVFKGAHTRELVYERPVSRYCCDIDVLIHPQDKQKAIQLLIDNGYKLYIKEKDLTHEVSLIANNVYIDLHWHIMRPGRVPLHITDNLLSRRVKQDGYWALNETDSLYILLIHHIFTKYSGIVEDGLIRFADLVYWMRKIDVNWKDVVHLLSQSEVCSAAWITTTYLELLTSIRFPMTFKESIAPSKAKMWYLGQLIARDLPSRFKGSPTVPKIFFTLLAHDSFTSVRRFYFTMKNADRSKIEY